MSGLRCRGLLILACGAFAALVPGGMAAAAGPSRPLPPCNSVPSAASAATGPVEPAWSPGDTGGPAGPIGAAGLFGPAGPQDLRGVRGDVGAAGGQRVSIYLPLQPLPSRLNRVRRWLVVAELDSSGRVRDKGR